MHVNCKQLIICYWHFVRVSTVYVYSRANAHPDAWMGMPLDALNNGWWWVTKLKWKSGLYINSRSLYIDIVGHFRFFSVAKFLLFLFVSFYWDVRMGGSAFRASWINCQRYVLEFKLLESWSSKNLYLYRNHTENILQALV